MQDIIKQLRKIEKLGTRVVSFDYHGKPRNVLVGRKDVQACPQRALALSRDIHYNRGTSTICLRGVDQNDGHKVKNFKVEDIHNLQGI